MKSKVIKLNGLVYVTSEEVINYNEYFISFISDEVQIEKENPYKLKLSKELYKKIILTNDPKLTTVQQLTQEEVEYCMGVDEVNVVKEIIAYDNQNRKIDFAFEKDDYTKNFYKIQIPKQETIEEWEKSWEIVNNQLENGVNPHAYRLGFLAGQKLQKQQTPYSD